MNTPHSRQDAVSNKDGAVVMRPVLDSGIWALIYVVRRRGFLGDPQFLAHELALNGRFSTKEDLLRGARLLGFDSRLIADQKPRDLMSVHCPCILPLREGGFVVLKERLPQFSYLVVSPDGADRWSRDDLSRQWGGEFILLAKSDATQPTTREFNFAWFLRILWRYRKPLTHVAIASASLQVFALATPMMFQVVIDKVLLHKSLSTLYLVVVGLIVVGFFDALLQYLRTFALAHTGTRLDAEIGSTVFLHLMNLPLSYFEARPTGQTVARMRELDRIRSFLTGQGMSSVIDLAFVFIFAAVLSFYSVKLFLIVLASLPFYVATATAIRPLLRARIQEQFKRGAASQQFLVETVVGAHTLKAAATEPIVVEEWNERLSAFIGAGFRSATLASAGSAIIQYIGKVNVALILLVGAQEVIAGQMTVGALVAFNMISGLLYAPILRLSQLWQDIQQMQISVKRVGDIIEAEPEPHSSFGAETLPRVRGAIAFEELNFRYAPATKPTLNRLTLDIPAGQIVGIVGPSGSGKSTVAKLLQRFYLPESGRITIDGIDIAHVPPHWVRKNIGVVLQDTMLFNRSIRDNIALASPNLSAEEVIALAILSGAHDFITRLPMGYDTMIVERGANLSGGQRQRIAIARALARNPRILIFDEATSALDYESEQVIQRNMRSISANRTVLIIAHRLAAVRGCDRIISLIDGTVIEDGSHDELVQNNSGHYRRLWAMQGSGTAL
jgi:subfamily B ATP-binding cassette protein HlyB/CyaB